MDPVLRHLITNARSEAVRVQFLQAPTTEYTTHQGVTVLAASYNVNGRAPPPDADLREWLAMGGSHGEPNVVAVGFQELVPLNASNVVMGEWRCPSTTHMGLISEYRYLAATGALCSSVLHCQ